MGMRGNGNRIDGLLICVGTSMRKVGSMLFTGMDGIDGVEGIGMGNPFGFMDGFVEGDGFEIWSD
jgi:hypothetical protein